MPNSPSTSPEVTPLIHGVDYLDEVPLTTGYLEYSESLPAPEFRYIEDIQEGLLDTPILLVNPKFGSKGTKTTLSTL
ncbi:hypothetical protein AYI69_g5874 [Smittium culicis]|uniref:Uncharacterized protein n=1 Tax=Smittium culicis TaxID=133412 RepID=A0A1R1Y366_9FUNG|nr:hypothetical protein AYI69_g5874 [Smittium culicis]